MDCVEVVHAWLYFLFLPAHSPGKPVDSRTPRSLMSILDTFWFVVLSPTFQQQIAPIFVLLLVPTLVLAVATRRERSSLVHSFLMGLDSLGFVLPWNWYSNGTGNGTHDRKKKKKKSRHASVTDLVELDGLRKGEWRSWH